MKYWTEYAANMDELPVINPGPGEYVHVMEGYKNGYQNLVIGITETFPGGAPPMHTHKGEESHVLLEGEIYYALGDTLFTITAPYIINIPPMVPHAFKNIGNRIQNKMELKYIMKHRSHLLSCTWKFVGINTIIN